MKPTNLKDLVLPLTLVLMAAVPASTSALAEDPVARTNKIINGLKPVERGYYERPSYRKHIKRILIPYGYHKRSKPKGYRTLYVNYNHHINLAVFFKKNSAYVLPKARYALDDLGRALISPYLTKGVYLIAGHTDVSGQREYNQWLSEQRARAVKHYLVKNFGIDPRRLVTAGFGEERLLDPHRPYAGVNRRVEVALIEQDYRYAPSTSYKLPPLQYVPPTDYKDAYPTSAKGYHPPYYLDDSDYSVNCSHYVKGYTDPRPVKSDLDDYGGYRTPADCFPYAESAETPKPGQSIEKGSAEQNKAIGN